MATLPPSTDFTGSTVTEGGFKTAITSLINFLSGLMGSAGDAGTALSTLGALAAGNVQKTAGYTVVAADRGDVIECNGTFTVAITAAATLGSGFNFIVKNTGGGVITIDPNGSELIDGSATITLNSAESAVVSCNGTAFWSVGKSATVPPGQFIGYQVFTASGTYTATTGTNSVIVEVQAGGGTGGAGGGTNSASGGGAGGYAMKRITSGFGGTAVTVGGGAAASSFGAFCSATAGGNGATNNTGTVAGGVGGIGSGGDINLRGNAAPTAVGASNVWQVGGSSPRFGGVSNTNGGAGQANSGAGGNGNASIPGGSGGSGIVIVWEYK